MRRTFLIALMLLLATTAVAAAAGRSAPQPSAHAAAPAPQLTADPLAVQPGATLTLQGRGFPRNAHVALMAGPPHGETTRIGGAQTGLRGRFTATIHIRPDSSAGRFVALACHDDCRVQASARFRIAP